MRVAALCDIHANLPALDAVLGDVRAAGVDLIVFGGDIVPGPMMRETFTRILGLDIPTQFIYGNGELGMSGADQRAESGRGDLLGNDRRDSAT